MIVHTDLLVVLQNSVDVFQLRVVWQKVNLMEVVVDFFPVGNRLNWITAVRSLDLNADFFINPSAFWGIYLIVRVEIHPPKCYF